MVDRRRGKREIEEKTAEAPAASARSDRLSLLAIGGGSVVTYPLPETGQVVIGRGENADVRINEPSISRRHALLRIEPSPAGTLLRIEDLGSSNGTRVREHSLAAHESMSFTPGDLIELGTTMFIVQRPPRITSQRHVFGHSYFEGRVAEECGRAERFEASFAVLRVRLDDRAGESEARVAIAAATEPTDVIAAYGAGEFELLLVAPRDEGEATGDAGAAAGRAEDVARRIDEALVARGVRAAIGLSRYPRDGRDPSSLLEKANPSARASSSYVQDAGARASIVVRDPRMQQLHRLLERVALGTINVLLLGETGVGKEVMAERVHAMSPRAQKPFVALNCAALSETLLESELFGHERGAFTGAVQSKRGLLESADGGTLFLDEVGELPMSLQVKLLRVLEERQVRRVGGLKSNPIDVRIVCATNRDLEAEVVAERFRQDLYFRLNGVALVIPPLRERTEELKELATTFIAQASAREKRKTPPRLSSEALALFNSYGWPGNVRELRNVIERAVLLCSGDEIFLEHLPVEKMQSTALEPPPPSSPGAPPMQLPHDSIPTSMARRATVPPAAETGDWSLRTAVDDFERQRILDALEQCAGNQSRAAKLLGISRNTLIMRLKTYGIRRPRAPT